MPIYDFRCTSCGFKAELMRKISAPSHTGCPNCSKETFAKMLSAPSFQLSGSGWYASDFKDKKTNNDKTTEKQPVEIAAEKTTDKTTEKTETKTADVDTKSAASNPGCF